jgi:hypothetical protein
LVDGNVTEGNFTELDRLKLMLSTVSRLESAKLISLEDCELFLPKDADPSCITASIPEEISSKIKFKIL